MFSPTKKRRSKRTKTPKRATPKKKLKTPVKKKTPSKSRGKSKSAKKKTPKQRRSSSKKKCYRKTCRTHSSIVMVRSASKVCATKRNRSYKHQHGKVFTILHWPSSIYSARCISNIAPIYGNGGLGHGIALVWVYSVIAFGHK